MDKAQFDNLPLLRRAIQGGLVFHGRSRRTEAVYYHLAVGLLSGIVDFALTTLLSFEQQYWAGKGLNFLLALPVFALFVRRLHDQNRSGWYSLILLPLLAYDVVKSVRLQILHTDAQSVPLETLYRILFWSGLPCVILLLVLMFLPGTVGPNRFGPDPRTD